MGKGLDIKGWYGSIDSRVKSEVLLYVITAVLSVVLSVIVLQLWNADMTVPFYTGGDETSLQGMVVKPLITQPWYQNNPNLAAPTGLEMQDYPSGTDSFLFLMLKVIAVVTRDSGVTINLFYLLTYPLIAMSMLFAARYIRLPKVLAVAVALLFAFAPYHIQRGEGHLMLSAYFMLPIGLVIALRIDSLLDAKVAAGKKTEIELRPWSAVFKDRFFIFACVATAIAAATGICYAMFWAFMVIVVAARRAIARGSWRSFVLPMAILGVLLASMLVVSSPTLIYQAKNGPNTSSVQRTPLDAEVYALRPVQLLLPMQNHRIWEWALENDRFGAFISQVSPNLNNETRLAALGVLGSIGFIFLLGWSILGGSASRDDEWSKYRLGDLASINLTMLLLGTVGGLGYIIADRISPMIRAYNRVSIAIGMVAILALGALIDRYLRKATELKWLVFAVAVVLVLFGLYDQTSPELIPKWDEAKAEVTTAREFAQSTQALLPKGSMVFQLPYAPFPDAGYSHLMPYIYSDGLKWSFGAIRGRKTAAWQENIASLPLASMVDELKKAGFAALYLDTTNLENGGAQGIADIKALLGEPDVTSSDGATYLWKLDK